MDLKSTGVQAPWGFESLALRHYFVPGRMFVNPAFDYLLIGGGLSLIVGLIAYANGLGFTRHGIPLILLLGNFAHFAASTVRLYTKPGAITMWPFLTLGFPFVTLAAFTALLMAGETPVNLLFALFLVWSPFHYSAQTYGLSVMYAMRSGATLDVVDKRLLRLACLLPFALAYVLFVLWPNFYESFGFEHRLTAEAVVATINTHHFIVDAYIWKLRKDAGNRSVVEVPVPA